MFLPDRFDLLGGFSLPVFVCSSDRRLRGANALAQQLWPEAAEAEAVDRLFSSPLWETSLRRVEAGFLCALAAQDAAQNAYTLSLIPFSDEAERRGFLCAVDERRSALSDPAAAAALHDLKSPLATGIQALQLALQDHSLDAGTRRYLEIGLRCVSRASERLSDLARDADLADRSTYRFAPCRMNALLDAACRDFSGAAELAGRAFSHYLSEADTVLPADAPLLRSAVDNLLSNALRHGSGAIRLTAAEGDGRFSISVWSEGAPIPEERLPYLFAPFFTTAPGQTLSGLGLYIVSAVACAHGGAVECVPDAGGNTFRLILPAESGALLSSAAGPYLLRLPQLLPLSADP